jgi:hypothetical protein
MQRSRIGFTPVRLKARHDGWNAERQRRFIDELAATRSLTRACQAVRMTRTAPYKLRDRPDAAEFRRAWDAAFQLDVDWRPRSPGAIARARLKVGKVEKMEGPPDSLTPPRSTSSALRTLQTYLALLRAQDERLGSARGG